MTSQFTHPYQNKPTSGGIKIYNTFKMALQSKGWGLVGNHHPFCGAKFQNTQKIRTFPMAAPFSSRLVAFPAPVGVNGGRNRTRKPQ